MKRMMALLLAMVLLLGCTPAMALEKKYQSVLLGTTVTLPKNLDVITEIPLQEQDGSLIFFSIPDSNVTVIGTMYYVPEFEGLQTKDLPKEEIEGWKEYFSADYPKHSRGVMLRPPYNSSQRIFRYYGMNKTGSWILSYSGVRDGLYVSVSAEAERFGYKADVMKAIFEAFNDCFQMFAMSRGVEFTRYDPDDFDVVIFNLLYDDSPESIFRNY